MTGFRVIISSKMILVENFPSVEPGIKVKVKISTNESNMQYNGSRFMVIKIPCSDDDVLKQWKQVIHCKNMMHSLMVRFYLLLKFKRIH